MRGFPVSVGVVVWVRISSPGWEGRWKSSVIDPINVGQLSGIAMGKDDRFGFCEFGGVLG
jgi:hypothetical protein